MTSDAYARIARTSIQVGAPAILAAVAAATTEVGKITEWWAPLALAVLSVLSSAIHQVVRPVVGSDAGDNN
jgi:hypothetical protein